MDAMEPPPAPIVVTSRIGSASGSPNSTSNRPENCSSPSVITPTSALVPPMSSVTALSVPTARAKCAPAIIPAARPDSTISTGLSGASGIATCPPLDLSRPCQPPTCISASWAASDPAKSATMGFT